MDKRSEELTFSKHLRVFPTTLWKLFKVGKTDKIKVFNYLTFLTYTYIQYYNMHKYILKKEGYSCFVFVENWLSSTWSVWVSVLSVLSDKVCVSVCTVCIRIFWPVRGDVWWDGRQWNILPIFVYYPVPLIETNGYDRKRYPWNDKINNILDEFNSNTNMSNWQN